MVVRTLPLFVLVLIAAPAACAAQDDHELLVERLPEHQVLAAAQQRRWDDVLSLCSQLEQRLVNRARGGDVGQTYGRQSSRRLIEWARETASAHLEAGGEPGLEELSGPARHPLVERLSKESFNLIDQFDAALTQGEYRHACRLITEFADPQDWGLLSDPRDPRLIVTLPLEIELAVFRHPELCSAMEEHFGPLGGLRVAEAIARHDAHAVEAAAWRFYGSRASADAQRWLGDRWLSLGQAVEATEHYGIGLVGASADQREALLARSRLAAALLGFDVGTPAKDPVRLGDIALPPERFEAIVAGLLGVRAKGATLTVGAGRGGDFHRARCPAPAALTAEYRAQAALRSNPMPPGFDWAARQVAPMVIGDKLLLAATGQLMAYSQSTGKRLWLRQWPGWHHNPWLLVEATQPIVGGNRVYLRHIGDDGYQIASIDTSDGTIDFTTELPWPIASDPLLLGDDLIALAVDPLAGDLLGLSLLRIDAGTGNLLGRVRLAQFRNHHQGALPCRMTAMGNRIVATASGTVVCCDLGGNLQWIRRQLWMPPVEEFDQAALRHSQIHRPPLVHRGVVVVTQPGVWAVEGIDLRTGRLVWRTAVPGLQTIGGHYRGRVIVETTYGLTALDPATGETLWNHPVELRLAALACGPPGGIVYARLDSPAQPTDQRERRASLVWLNPATGRPLYRLPLRLAKIEDADPLLGPLVVGTQRHWVLAAPADQPTRRQLYELAAPAAAAGRSESRQDFR